MHTYHIHIEGQVQGVGFRPFVYKLARQFNLTGWVNNTIDGVHIEINADSVRALAFYEDIVRLAPPLARITAHHMWETEPVIYDDFRIVHSRKTGEARLLLSPDFALCDACRAELLNPADRRYRYPFITCTLCGPRYSIIGALPYDRERTTMSAYTMCPVCEKEYHDVFDRRYYSQTNSCADCGVRLALYDAERQLTARGYEKSIERTVQALRNGRIVAVKGIGGYLLCCDAANPESVRCLRERKVRPDKPFALMYPGLHALRLDVHLRKAEEKALRSTTAPIVLLDLKPAPASGIAVEQIAPGLGQIGVMLPYAPLYELLLREFDGPIVATSGNRSNSPIIFEDEKAPAELSGLADYMLVNDRMIRVPQDDSVIRFSAFEEQRIILRRSRGLAPTYIQPDLDLPNNCVLAMGAELKSTFTLLHQQNTYISQYLGDLDSFDTQRHFRHTLEHLLQLFEARPELVIVDKHPGYFAAQLGRQLASSWQVPVLEVQHHLAHFAAVLAERQLLNSDGPILGLIWDGTGYGDDGNIWGGEHFLYQNGQFTRAGHLSYFDFPLGDKMPREPRISALALAHDIEGAETWLRPKFSETEWKVYQQMLSRGRNLQTSSIGRLFDGVSSLLNQVDLASYEGQAAMRLEHLAARYIAEAGPENVRPFETEGLLGEDTQINAPALMRRLQEAVKKEMPPELIAARFHATLARLAAELAAALNVEAVCCSGGVFQNAVLCDLLSVCMEEKVELYFHRQLSPNDEGVSFGQLAYAMMMEALSSSQETPGGKIISLLEQGRPK